MVFACRPQSERTLETPPLTTLTLTWCISFIINSQTIITLLTKFQPSQSHCSDAVASAIPVVIIHGLSEQHRHFHFVTAPELGLVGLADKLKLGRGRVGAAVFLAGAARGAPVLVRAAARAAPGCGRG